MRYGIPSNFDFEVSTAPVDRDASKVFSLESSNLSLIKHIKNNFSPTSLKVSNPMDIVSENTNESTRRLYIKAKGSLKDDDEKLNSFITANRLRLKNNVNFITMKMDELMMIQKQDVEKVVAEEKRIIQERLEKEKQAEIERQEREKRKQEEARKLEEKQERERIQLLEQEKLKQEEFKKQKKLEEEKMRREKELEEKRSAGFTNTVAVEREFVSFKQDIASIKKDVVGSLNANPDMKKSVNQLKRKINPKFGQLSNSLSQLKKINDEVIELVEYSKSIGDIAYRWILNFVAKAIVAQAETEVIVQPAAALPLARIAYSLLNRFEEFAYFLIARFVKKCPFIIGYTCSIESEEGRTKMGWKRRDEKWEDDVKYDERVSGICSVWSTMTRLNDFPQVKYFSIEDSWKFLARLLNTDIKLITNAHFSIAANWWETCGKDFLSNYKNQGSKLLQALAFHLTGSCADRRFPAAARLNILGEEWVQSNSITSIKEMEN